MQPSAPLTTDCSTSATVPEQTSAWGAEPGRPQGHGGVTGSAHKVPGTKGTEISTCTRNTRGQDREAHNTRMNQPDTRGQAHAALTRVTLPSQTPQDPAPTRPRGLPRSQRSSGARSPCAPRPTSGWGLSRRRRVGRRGAREGDSQACPPPPPQGCTPPPVPPLPPGPSPAPRPGGRRRRRQTSWALQRSQQAGNLRCLGARGLGHKGSPASSVGPPSGRTVTSRLSAGPPGPARHAA